MEKPPVITTPSGDQMVVLPLGDYERLIASSEDLADVRAYDEARRRIDSGEDELIPAEFANRILDGESPLRVFRDLRGFSAKDLAAKVEVSPAYLSQLETGERDGSLKVWKKIADALNVDLSDLA